MADKTAVRSILGAQIDDTSVLAQALLKVINSTETVDEKAEVLSIALLERDSVPKVAKALPNTGVPDDEWDQLNKFHIDTVQGHLRMAFFKNRTVEGFAREILRLVDFFQEDNEKAFVLAAAIYSPYVPFKQLPGTPINMSYKELIHKLESSKDHLELIEYIIDLPFSEYTERASMLLQVIDDTKDRGLRIALLAAAWQKHERNIIKENKDEED